MSSKKTLDWGPKANKLPHEQPVRVAKGSLKKITYCKKTKGDHVFSWVDKYPRSATLGIEAERCRLCGKEQGFYRYRCMRCSELYAPFTKHEETCSYGKPSGRTLASKTG